MNKELKKHEILCRISIVMDAKNHEEILEKDHEAKKLIKKWLKLIRM